jgi:hypothetical protein
MQHVHDEDDLKDKVKSEPEPTAIHDYLQKQTA